MTFTREEKIAELEREIAMRRRVYPSMIARGHLSLTQATKQIDVMRQIVADYQTDQPAEA